MPASNPNASPTPQAVPWEADGLRLHVLGSGSQGNCCAVECPQGIVLVDAGLTCKQIVLRMESLGLDPARVGAIVVTHEHTDHISGLRVAAKKLGAPVFASAGTLGSASWKRAGGVAGEALLPRRTITLCGIEVTPFAVPHDATEPLGFRFERAGDAIGYCTDLGCVTPQAGAYLADARILALESNHDPALLSSYEGYPAYLKARIAGNGGHLSNVQAAAALAGLATARTQTVVGMHVSQHTNLPSACRAALEGAGRGRVLVASQASPMSCL